MATIEVSCPNCGASGGVPAPHATRICEFCGTHFLLKPSAASVPADPEPADRPAGQSVDVSAIVIAIFVMAVLLAAAAIIIVAVNSDASSNPAPQTYHAPGR